jgi:hypothetical protein
LNLTEYLEQKRKSLIATNKNLSDEKLRVEGAWLILQEIEEIVGANCIRPLDETTPSGNTRHPSTEGNETTPTKSPKGDFEEEKPKSKTKKRGK